MYSGVGTSGFSRLNARRPTIAVPPEMIVRHKITQQEVNLEVNMGLNNFSKWVCFISYFFLLILFLQNGSVTFICLFIPDTKLHCCHFSI